MFIFGHYTMETKTYTAAQLGVKGDDARDMKFVVRVKVFHFFGIPAFPLATTYGYRKGGMLFDLPKEYIPVISKLGKHSAPWYTFLFPIIVAAGVLLFALSIGSLFTGSSSFEKSEYVKSVADMDQEMGRLSTYNYLEVLDAHNHKDGAGIFLKVIGIKDSNVICARMNTGITGYQVYAYAITDFYNQHQPFDTVVLSRQDIRNAICRDYESFNKGGGIKMFHDAGTYCIDKILYINGPSLVFKKSDSEPFGHRFDILLINYGAPAQLIKIKNIDNNAEWLTDLPMDVPTNYSDQTYFTIHSSGLKHSGPYKVQLTFTDTSKQLYKFDVWARDPANMVGDADRVRE